MKPITPAQAKNQRRAGIPDFVFDVVNTLLVENLNSTCTGALLLQKDIAKAIREHPEYQTYDEPRPDIYKQGWMDFEEHYKQAGWKVDYDRPGYNENYEPKYIFSSR